MSAPGALLTLLATWVLVTRYVDPFTGNLIHPVIAVALITVLSVSIPQWLLLRYHVGRAGIWIAANLAGAIVSVPLGWIGRWMIGFPLAMFVTELTNGHIGGIVGGAMVVVIAGFVQSTITGVALARLLRSYKGEEVL